MKLSDLIVLKENNVPADNDINPVITTSQAAKKLGVTPSRVRQLIGQGRLNANGPKKGRRDNMLKIDDVSSFAKKDRKITGRPKGAKNKQ